MDVHGNVACEAVATSVAWDPEDPILARMQALADSEAAIDLRIGELLAFVEAAGVLSLGHTSTRGFLDNEVDFDRSWATRLKLLAESRLFAVKAAMCRNEIPTSAAVEADRAMTLAEQA